MTMNLARTGAFVAVACAAAFSVAGCGNRANTAGAPATVAPAPSPSLTSQSIAPAPASSQSVPSRSPSPEVVVPPASTTPSTTATPVVTPALRNVTTVYLLSNGRIAASHRVVLGPPVARGAVEALLAGPTASDTAFGYVSKVPSSMRISGLTVSGGTAHLSLSGNASVPTAGVAQLVATLTQFSSVERVALTLNGKPLTLPSAGESLTRVDIESMLPAVLVESPTVGETVRTPVRVVGSANTFEAVFRLEITDWDGRIVASQIVHAASGTGTRGAFDVTIPFVVNRTGIGELIASYDSAKDGSRVVVAEIPLHVSE